MVDRGGLELINLPNVFAETHGESNFGSKLLEGEIIRILSPCLNFFGIINQYNLFIAFVFFK